MYYQKIAGCRSIKSEVGKPGSCEEEMKGRAASGAHEIPGLWEHRNRAVALASSTQRLCIWSQTGCGFKLEVPHPGHHKHLALPMLRAVCCSFAAVVPTPIAPPSLTQPQQGHWSPTVGQGGLLCTVAQVVAARGQCSRWVPGPIDGCTQIPRKGQQHMGSS